MSARRLLVGVVCVGLLAGMGAARGQDVPADAKPGKVIPPEYKTVTVPAGW